MVKKLNEINFLYRVDQKKKSLDTLREVLIKYIGYKNGYFVELGANDRISQSNTLYLEKT